MVSFRLQFEVLSWSAAQGAYCMLHNSKVLKGIIVLGVPFILSLSTATLSHKNPVSSGTCYDSAVR